MKFSPPLDIAILFPHLAKNLEGPPGLNPPNPSGRSSLQPDHDPCSGRPVPIMIPYITRTAFSLFRNITIDPYSLSMRTTGIVHR